MKKRKKKRSWRKRRRPEEIVNQPEGLDCSVFRLWAHPSQAGYRGWDSGRWPYGLGWPKLQPTNPSDLSNLHLYLIFLISVLSYVSGPAPCSFYWPPFCFKVSTCCNLFSRNLILLFLFMGGIHSNPGPYTAIPDFNQASNHPNHQGSFHSQSTFQHPPNQFVNLNSQTSQTVPLSSWVSQPSSSQPTPQYGQSSQPSTSQAVSPPSINTSRICRAVHAASQTGQPSSSRASQPFF